MANEIKGQCMVCGKMGTMHSCMLCGSLVCELHYDPETGLCTECKKGRRTCRDEECQLEDEDVLS